EECLEAFVRQTVVDWASRRRPTWTSDLERTQSLLKCFLERPSDRHRLAHGLHLRGEIRTRRREFLERESRHFHDDIVEHRLERRRRRLCDVVRDLRSNEGPRQT